MPSITHRSDGRWMGRVVHQGRTKSVYGKTRKEVEAKLKTVTDQLLIVGELVPRMSLAELLHRFLDVGRQSWKPRTIHEYERYVTMLISHFGDCDVTKLTPATVQALYQLYKDRPRKALFLHQVLHRALALAVLWGVLPSNPADRVVKPKSIPKPKTLWTVDQLHQFTVGITQEHLFPLVLLAIHSGLRLGEMLALQWGDVDGTSIRVQRSLSQTGGQYYLTSPKTRSGVRTVAVGQDVVDILLALPRTGEYIFQTRNGTFYSRHYLSRWLTRWVRKVGLPPTQWHSFRHLHASLAIKGGAPITLVSRQLGHSNVGITTTIYAHAIGDGAQVSDAVRKSIGSGYS